MTALKDYNMVKAGSAAACTALLLMLAVVCPSAAAAEEVDWKKVEGKIITTFYPGVASWDFVRSQDHGSGAPIVQKRRKTCMDCHVGQNGEYDINANKIISGELKKSASKDPFEPQPLSGVSGFKDVEVKAAYDADNIYLRFQWQGSGASVADPSLAKKGKADRISVQINDNIKSFESYGCFIACHNDQSGMPGNRGKDTKLYGYYTRKGENVEPQNVLDQYLAKGQFIDLWVVSFEGPKVKASDAYILQDRVDDQNDLSVSGGFADGKYTVVITRKLSTGDPKDIALRDGSTFSLGLAIHDNKNEGRHHYSSFPVSIGLSTSAMVVAQKF